MTRAIFSVVVLISSPPVVAQNVSTAGDTFPPRAGFSERRAIELGATQRIVPRRNLSIRNRSYTDTYRLFDDPDGIASGSRFENLTATVSRGGFRLRGDVHDIAIRNVELTLAVPTHAPELPAGIEVQGTAHDVLIEEVTASGFRMVAREGHYTNGDGFSSERGVSHVTFRRTTANDNSDGGFDLKSTDTKLDDTTSEANNFNYRLWGTGEATRVTSIAPRKGHFQFNTQANWHIRNLVARSRGTQPILIVQGDATVTIDHCELDVPPETKFLIRSHDAHPHLTLGAGCSLG